MAVAAGVIYGFSLKATREEGKKTNTVSSSSFRVESYTQYRHTHTAASGEDLSLCGALRIRWRGADSSLQHGHGH